MTSDGRLYTGTIIEKEESEFPLAHAVFVVFVIETSQIFARAIAVLKHKVGVRNAVEHGGFHCSIVIHVKQSESVAGLWR